MIVVINKLGECLEYKYENIKLVEKLNHLAYKISLDDKKKYDEIDFDTMENAENEYPIMIIVEKGMKHLFEFNRDMKKNINIKNKFIEKIMNYGNKKYNGLWKYMFLAKLKTKFFRFKLYFYKLYFGGILNMQIKADTPEIEDLYPDFYESYLMLKSINKTHDSVLKILKELKEIVIKEKIGIKKQEDIFLASVNYI